MKSRFITLFIAFGLMLLAVTGCTSSVDSGVDPTGTSGTAGLSSIQSFNTLTVTPAPSGFVPGDALPTPNVYPTPSPAAIAMVEDQPFRELTWEELVPPGYRPEDIMAKYQDELNAFQDGDPAAWDLYQQMQEEFNSAPVNSQLNQSSVRLPGFIAPLEYDGDLITEFLLVPYFGACIHVPPPPVNQTVHVSLADGEGITPEDSFYPVWVQGFMITEGLSTDIGNAGYRIQDALVTPYEYPTG